MAEEASPLQGLGTCQQNRCQHQRDHDVDKFEYQMVRQAKQKHRVRQEGEQEACTDGQQRERPDVPPALGQRLHW